MKSKVFACMRVEADMTVSGNGWVFSFAGKSMLDKFVVHDRDPEAFRVGRSYKVSFEELKPEDKVTT
jgi:hypothetical protein